MRSSTNGTANCLTDRRFFNFQRRWSRIARHLPGRTDNEVKNFWRTKIQPKRHRSSDYSSTSSAMEAVAMASSMCRGMGIAGHSRSTPAVTEDQGSSSHSSRTGVTQDYGIVTQQPSISSVADQLGYGVHGLVGGGAMDVDFFLPELLAASGENFWLLGHRRLLDDDASVFSWQQLNS